jgi:hypothetical protein
MIYLSICLSVYLSVCLSVYLICLSMALQPFVETWPLFQVLDLSHGRTPSTGDQHVVRPLRAHRTAQRQNKHTQTSMPWVGFKPTIPVCERTKTVHALYLAATVIGTNENCNVSFIPSRAMPASTRKCDTIVHQFEVHNYLLISFGCILSDGVLEADGSFPHFAYQRYGLSLSPNRVPFLHSSPPSAFSTKNFCC